MPLTPLSTLETILLLGKIWGTTVNLRRPLIFLVYSLPVLVVAFGVLMGGQALSRATNDQAGAALYWRGAILCLMLLVVNLILLVGVLGIDVLNRPDPDEKGRSQGQDTSS